MSENEIVLSILKMNLNMIKIFRKYIYINIIKLKSLIKIYLEDCFELLKKIIFFNFN